MKKAIAMFLAIAMALSLAACGGGGGGGASAGGSGSAGGGAAGSGSAGGSSAGAGDALDLNALTLDEIIEGAKAEGHVESVGMPDNWADWAGIWEGLKTEYGLTHADTDMSSSEELQMFKTEGKNGTKDIGDVGYAFGNQAIEEDLVQGYKTSYWDSVPDWAKAEDGKWMVAYTGVTTFLTNSDLVANAPTSWQDIRDGDYKVAIGPLTGGNGQGAVVASALAFGGSLDNLDPAFEFWTEMAEAGRISTLDITQQNFETGEIPVGVVWSYTGGVSYVNNITQYKMVAGVPSDGALQVGYASVINKNAPHPHAAALAREYIFSDAGQQNLSEAGAIPTRTDVEGPFSAEELANVTLMSDADAYSAACEAAAARWEEEITPLLVQ